MGQRMLAGAKLSAEKLMSAKVRKTVNPPRHALERHGKGWSAACKLRTPFACRFCPTFIPIEPAIPMMTPTGRPQEG
jgi:hypothetical protein